MALPQLFRFDQARRKDRDTAETRTRTLMQAAERESNEIVLNAAAEVRKIVVEARRDLALVQMQIEATVPTLDPSKSARDSSAREVRQKVVERVSDLAKDALNEARREVDGLLGDVNGYRLPREAPAAAAASTAPVRRVVTIRWQARPALTALSVVLLGVVATWVFTGRRLNTGSVTPTPVPSAAAPVAADPGPTPASSPSGAPAAEPSPSVSPAPDAVRSDPAAPVVSTSEPVSREAVAGPPTSSPRAASASKVPRPALPDAPDAVDASVQVALRDASDRWLQSYFVLGTAPAPALQLQDERQPHERVSGAIRRDIAKPRIDVFGDAAVVTTSVTEHPQAGPALTALVSQLWTRKAGQWHLDDVRIVSGNGAAKAFGR